ncbi:hypothetical protein OWV82_022391 [Melia azedarach]|uniref:Uncharacterized protein n=1 Tax=Melia azedarach TaxID=155640 RepID=A0ACC1X2F5_MELAZ|nr:hypothetical protein OWV82_022391 [Melia azedarach]
MDLRTRESHIHLMELQSNSRSFWGQIWELQKLARKTGCGRRRVNGSREAFEFFFIGKQQSIPECAHMPRAVLGEKIKQIECQQSDARAQSLPTHAIGPLLSVWLFTE